MYRRRNRKVYIVAGIIEIRKQINSKRSFRPRLRKRKQTTESSLPIFENNGMA